MSDIVIRGETPADYAAVEDLVRESFWNVYRPGCLEHFVLHRLRDAPEFVRERSGLMFGAMPSCHASSAASQR